MKCGTSNIILCIDTVNPEIKSLGSTYIMSSVEEKTPTVSSGQGAMGETATSVWLAEADETTKESKATDTGDGKGR